MLNTLPPEWAPQDAVILTWPHSETDWAENLEAVEAVFIEISLAILAQQSLIIICHNHELKKHVVKLFDSYNLNNRLFLVVAACDDCWARDHGPLSVINENNEVVALNFTFNGWGNKYPSTEDNKINAHLVEQLSIANSQTVDMVLEGGAIEIDEQGHLLTTENCLLNPNRNADMDKGSIELALKKYLGANKVLWLRSGALQGDDTDSHIDTLARFAPNETIIFQGCDQQDDVHYVELQKMKNELKALRTQGDQPFALVELPWPDAQVNEMGSRLPATYANFLIINNAVLMPTYGVKQDITAQQILASVFTDREIVPIDARAIIEQFGSLHCLTMQIPQGLLIGHNQS